MKWQFIALCLLALPFVFASPDEGQRWSQWLQWKDKFGKVYANGVSELTAYSNFKATLDRVAARQARYDAEHGAGITGFGPTIFADMTPEIWRAKYLNGLDVKALREARSKANIAVAPVPTTVDPIPDIWDWRKHNAVTEVKDQGQCGSCWAFSVIETVESAWFLKGHPLGELSPQQVVDCDKKDQGCDGGDPPLAFQYIIEAGGLESERNYPYTAFDQSCKFDPTKVVAKVSNWTYAVPPCNDTCKHQNETLLRQQLVALGPLSICVQADDAWQDYQWGPLMDFCPMDFDLLNHAVQLVGYDAKFGTYTVRNSWSDQWGEQGYIRLVIGRNQCGLADEVTAAVI
jgi:hypothetical protein